MPPTLIPYADDATDFPRLTAYLRDVWSHSDFTYMDYHVADAVWQRFRVGFDAPLRLALWELDGRVTGLTWFDGPDEVTISVHPSLASTPAGEELFDRQLEWAEGRRATYAERGEPSDALATTCLRNDARTEALLAARGFAPDEEDAYQINRRSLLDALPDRPVAEGYRLVDITDDGLIPERVAIHREVWHPSKITEEGYRWMRSRPEYDPTLDLMAVAGDGEAAAYAICWVDAETKTAVFEPVGARSSHRRRGLAAAVLAEGMRRARAKGAETIFVSQDCDPDALPADRLYASVGFQPLARWRFWRRPSPSVTST